ncbi:efflux RND transporter periplasmic adaptor subunit [Vibrio amylolyticus]|uniref:efflux RND transporter periplasmic adaptor subunit n=1 Tax=Vibrio amylolyticus TaxID=2847292 RepID=UPI00354B2B98
MNRHLITYLVCAMVISPSSYAVELIGKTASKKPVNVVSEISGVIEQANLQTGDVITQGQRLATVKDQDFKLEVRKQQANVSLVKADLDIKQSVYTRYQELRAKNSLSQNELDVAKADYAAAQASLSLAKIELEKAMMDLSSTNISTAINGHVVERVIEEGAWVNKGDLLYRLTNIDQLNVRLLASEFDLQALSVGQPIQLWSEAQPTQQVVAEINRISVELDTVTFSYIIEVDINNAQHLFKPGMSIHATTEFDTNSNVRAMTTQ